MPPKEVYYYDYDEDRWRIATWAFHRHNAELHYYIEKEKLSREPFYCSPGYEDIFRYWILDEGKEG